MSMSNEEKREILDVQEEEVIQQLGVDVVVEQVMQPIMSTLHAQERITSLRLIFVQALSEEGVIKDLLPEDLIGKAILGVFDLHLSEEFARRTIMGRMFLLVCFLLYYYFHSWFIRWFAIISFSVACWLGTNQWAPMQKFHQAILKLVADKNNLRTEIRAHSLLSGVVCLFLGSWVPWYSILVFLLLLPLLCIELERLVTTTKTDSAAVKYIAWMLVYINCVIALYFSWHSYSCFLFMASFFFPLATSVLISGILVAIWFVLQLVASIQKLVFEDIYTPLGRRIGINPYILWLPSLLLSCVTYYWSYSSWFYFTINFLCSSLLGISAITMGVATVAQTIAVVLVSDWSISTVLSEFVVSLVVIAVVFVISIASAGFSYCKTKCCGSKAASCDDSFD